MYYKAYSAGLSESGCPKTTVFGLSLLMGLKYSKVVRMTCSVQPTSYLIWICPSDERKEEEEEEEEDEDLAALRWLFKYVDGNLTFCTKT